MQMSLDGMQLAAVAHVERAQRRTIQMFVGLAMPQFGFCFAVQHDRLGILIHLVEILAQNKNLSFTHCEKILCLALIFTKGLSRVHKLKPKLSRVNKYVCLSIGTQTNGMFVDRREGSATKTQLIAPLRQRTTFVTAVT